MTYLFVGIGLFLWGLVVGYVGPKLGSVLAVLPLAPWFILMFGEQAGGQSGSGTPDLAAVLMIGLVAFLGGANITERAGARRRRSRGFSREGHRSVGDGDVRGVEDG